METSLLNRVCSFKRMEKPSRGVIHGIVTHDPLHVLVEVTEGYGVGDLTVLNICEVKMTRIGPDKRPMWDKDKP